MNATMTKQAESTVTAADTRKPGWLARFLSTESEIAPLIARVALGAVIFPHGAQKLLGWFGGYGFSATMGWFTQQAGIPAPLAFLVILAESLGALALVLGLAGRFMAFGIASVMAGAVVTTHLANGFWMNWAGNQKGEGFEYHLLAAALAVIVMVKGSGAWSADRWVSKRIA